MNIIQKSFRALCKGEFFSRLYLHFFLVRKGYKIFNILVPFIKKKNKILCDNFVGKGYGDNPKYIVEEFHRQMPDFEIIFLVEKNTDLSLFPDYVRTVRIYSLRHLYEMASSKFWIFNYRKAVHINKKHGQFYIQTWHGNIGPKKCERSAEKTLDTFYLHNAKEDSTQIDVCISGSSHLTNVYKNDFWYSGEILESGYPRADILFDALAACRIKKEMGVEGKRICMYAPTFRNSHSLDSYCLNYSTLKNALEEKLGGEWIVFLRLHPNMANVELKSLPEYIKNVSPFPDVQELLAAADCLITDYSSIIYEFMLTKRPAFIFATDLQAENCSSTSDFRAPEM